MFTQLKAMRADNALHSEAGLALANTVFDSAERLVAHNLSASRKLMNASFAHLHALNGSQDVRTIVSLQAAQTKPAIDSAIAYSRGVLEITSEAKQEAAKIVEVQVADVSAGVSDIVDKALTRAPAGSETAVAAIRTAIDTANTAIGQISATAKQVAEIAEASAASATEAGFKAAAKAATIGEKVA